jgi:DNA-directed RNA polymerase specialized sigma24 family protein
VSSEGSITVLIGGMKSGDEDAARRIWERYSPRLAALARKKLPTRLQRIVDGEDLANSAMCNVIMGLRAGRFPDLHGRDDLWALLAYITVRKAFNEIAKAACQKRLAPGASVPLDGQIVAPDLPPHLEAKAAEQFKFLLDLVHRKEAILEPIALWKFEGYTNDEIAQRLGCSRSKVGRKLELIRKIWEAEEPR